MNALLRERIIVSVGGSLMVPDQIDTDFLTRLRAFVLKKVSEGFSFCFIAGGGSTSRRYQDAASKVTPLSSTDLDWIGIHATRLNAHLLRTLFAGEAYGHVIKNPAADIDISKPIIVAAGWQPGCSTDYDAVLIAKNLGAHRLVNLSDVDYVYDKDPKKHKGAKKLEKISWSEFRAIMPDHWDPGLASPFDPIAAKEAESIALEVAIMNGAHLDRFEAYLERKPFVGTVIA
jgi:uridylate kinase